IITPVKPKLFIILIIDPECRGLCFMPMDREVAAIPEKEKLKSIIKIILRVTKSKKKEINKKTKASIEENCIIFFPLNLVNKERFNIKQFGNSYKSYMEKVPRMNLILGFIKIFKKSNK
ncbi:unnamed protein product, partial [marine sediment metagenome]